MGPISRRAHSLFLQQKREDPICRVFSLCYVLMKLWVENLRKTNSNYPSIIVIAYKRNARDVFNVFFEDGKNHTLIVHIGSTVFMP